MGVYQIEEWKPVVGYEGLYEVSNTESVGGYVWRFEGSDDLLVKQ